MLIDKHIGNDKEDGIGVMGDEFAKELLFLDTLNKKRIQIWMVTEGGSVDDGEKIYAAILKSKTKVDTYANGLVASIGVPIYLAGRRHYMMPNAKLMVHNVHGVTDKVVLEKYNNSVAKMMSTRCGLSDSEIKALMEKTTWIDANEAKDLGLCDEIEDLGELNKPRKSIESDGVKAVFQECRQILNKIIETKKYQPMTKVTNRLKLTEFANEEAQVEAIDMLIKNKVEAEDKYAKLKAEMAEAEDKYNKLKNEFEAMDKKSKEEVANRLEADKAKDVATKKELVADGVKKYKIQNKAEVIKAHEDMVEKLDVAGAKAFIDALPVNRVGADLGEDKGEQIDEAINKLRPDIDLENPNAYVQKMNAQLLNKTNNRVK